jgi:hypothetical protein
MGTWGFDMRAYLAIPVVILATCCAPAAARDDLSSVTLVKDDGRYAASPLKAWFDKLASGKGLCCSFADGVSVEDVDWDTLGSAANDGSGYRVRINGQWVEVPTPALVTEPNKFGPAVVWPYQDNAGQTQIRCFIPGSGA